MIFTALVRFLARTPWSTGIALIGMTLASVSMVAVHQVSVAIEQQTRATSLVDLGDYNFFLHKARIDGAEYFALLRRWRAGEMAQIGHMAPVVDERRYLDDKAVRIVGIDLFSHRIGQLIVSQSGAQASDDTIPSLSGAWIASDLEGHWSGAVNGVLALPEGTALMDIGSAQDLLGYQQDRISYIAVKVADPWAAIKRTLNALAPGIGAGLPLLEPDLGFIRAAGFDVISLEAQNPANQLGRSILFNVGALGMLALVVAWFLIYQVAVSWLRRLWPTFSRLHVLGVPYRRLGMWFVVLVMVIAVVGSGLGLWLGNLLAEWLLARIATAPSGVQLDGWVIGKTLVCGLGVCLLGALLAWRAALHDAMTTDWVLPVMWAVIAAVGYAWPALGLMGGFICIAASGFLVSSLIWPLLNVSKRLAHHMHGPMLLRLSAREVAWYPGDLAVAMSGLMLAVATALGIALMVDSFRLEFGQMLERRLAYEWVVNGSPDELKQAEQDLLDRYPEVRVQSYRSARTRVRGLQVDVQLTRLDRPEQSRYAFDGVLQPRDVWIGEQVALKLGVGIGDQLQVFGAPYRIGHVFKSFGDLYPRLLLDARHAAGLGVASELRSLSIDGAPNQALDSLRKLGVEVTDQGQIRRVALNTFDQTFLITDVLLAIALLVASLGIFIAINALRFNRRSSVPLLSSLGLSRWESLQMDIGRAAAVGVIAVAIALPLGIWFAYLLCHLVNPRAFGWAIDLHVLWDSLDLPIALGIGAALIAGVVAPGQRENDRQGAFG